MFEVDLTAARVVFTTRRGGVSDGIYASLNLGAKSKDDPELVRQNLAILQDQLELEHVHQVDQVHGGEIVDAGRLPAASRPQADGISTTQRHDPVMVLGADCPGVVLSSATRTTALHCGWRPVAAGIIESAARGFAGEPFDAVVGPGICQQHFEVGPEVIEAMGPDAAAFADGRQLDLSAVIAARLTDAGATRVTRLEHCTYCSEELFFSHRRDGETGRQAAVAWRI